MNDDSVFSVERPDEGSLRISVRPWRYALFAAAIAIFMVILFWSQWKTLPRWGVMLGILVGVPLIAWNAYVACVGRSFLFDGAGKNVTRNGVRVTSFAGIQSVRVGKNTLMTMATDTTDEVTHLMRTVSLLTKSGNKIEIATCNDADEINDIAAEIAAIVGVPVTEG